MSLYPGKLIPGLPHQTNTSDTSSSASSFDFRMKICKLFETGMKHDKQLPGRQPDPHLQKWKQAIVLSYRYQAFNVNLG